MKSRLIIDGNAVYELDEECLLQKKIPLPESAVTFPEEKETSLIQEEILTSRSSGS